MKLSKVKKQITLGRKVKLSWVEDRSVEGEIILVTDTKFYFKTPTDVHKFSLNEKVDVEFLDEKGAQ